MGFQLRLNLLIRCDLSCYPLQHDLFKPLLRLRSLRAWCFISPICLHISWFHLRSSAFQALNGWDIMWITVVRLSFFPCLPLFGATSSATRCILIERVYSLKFAGRARKFRNEAIQNFSEDEGCLLWDDHWSSRTRLNPKGDRRNGCVWRVFAFFLFFKRKIQNNPSGNRCLSFSFVASWHSHPRFDWSCYHSHITICLSLSWRRLSLE